MLYEPANRRDETFRAMADPTRRAILDRLGAHELTVGELCVGFDMSQPAVSQHLKVLREAGLVTVRREGRRRFYALDAGPLRAAFEWVARYESFWSDNLMTLGNPIDAMPTDAMQVGALVDDAEGIGARLEADANDEVGTVPPDPLDAMPESMLEAISLWDEEEA